MEQTTLNKRLNRQVRLAAWQMTVGIMFIIGMIIVSIKMFNTVTNFNGIGTLIDDLAGTIIILFIATFVLLIVLLVIWIMGIVNAVAINDLTNGKSIVLIIFSIFTFTIVHFIVAIVIRKRFIGAESKVSVIPQDEMLNKLKRAFENDVITAKEFEDKKAELNKSENSK